MSSSGHKRKLSEADDSSNGVDEPYFRAYADIQIHEDMIDDTVRTTTYRQAILRNYEKIYGKTVADIGAGTGILSMFCVQAGAKKVYAIEASCIAEQARLVIESNGLSGRVEVIQGRVEDIELPEKVDVIVSEWMGYFLVYESMLSSVLVARDRWLKKDGVMLPSLANLYLAPISDTEEYEHRLLFLDSIKSRYDVNMSAVKDYARKCLTRSVHVRSVNPQNVMAGATLIKSFDLLKVSQAEVQKITKSFLFDCFGTATIHGFTGWFTVEFPCATILSTSPYEQVTHWQQAVMYLKEPFNVEQGDKIAGTVSIRQSSTNIRFLDVDLTHSLLTRDEEVKSNGSVSATSSYVLNDGSY